MMDEKQITDALNALAAEAVPDDADLWPRIGARLRGRGAAAPTKGTLTMNPLRPTVPRWRLLGMVILTGLGVGLALAATPQGRLLAQGVWQFFNPAPAASFAVTPAAEAAEPATGPTAAPPAVAAEACGDDLACQLAAAEAALGFEALLPPGAIAGVDWIYVEALLESGTLRLGYAAETGGGLVITQSRGDLPTSPWEAVPADAAQAVSVGGQPAEYVEGTFVVTPGSDEAVWNPAVPLQRLRWRAGDRLFEISKMGDPEAVEYLDLAALVALAESLE
jgi:hypothetical protein